MSCPVRGAFKVGRLSGVTLHLARYSHGFQFRFNATEIKGVRVTCLLQQYLGLFILLCTKFVQFCPYNFYLAALSITSESIGAKMMNDAAVAF
ncbi:hypothetical protein D1872_214300 [compost metagenome]